MKNVLLFLILIVSISTSIAQTKVIFHKSHSGSKATFEKALGSKVFDMETSDFGLPDWADSKNTLDSVIFVNKNLQIVVLKKHCVGEDGYVDYEKPCKIQRDSFTNHPLLSQQHSLKSVEQGIRQYYDFRNGTYNIPFVGYDNENPEWVDFHPTYIRKITYIDKDTVIMNRELYKKDSIGRFTEKGKLIFVDTLIKHPLLSRKNNLTLVKRQLRNYYTIGHPVSLIHFVGYKDSRKNAKIYKKNAKEGQSIKTLKKEDKEEIEKQGVVSEKEKPVLLPLKTTKKESREIRKEKKKAIRKEKKARIKAAKKAAKEKMKSQEEDTGYRRPSDDVSPKSTISKPRPKLVSQESTKENAQAKKILPWWGLFGMSSIGLSLLIAFIKR